MRSAALVVCVCAWAVATIVLVGHTATAAPLNLDGPTALALAQAKASFAEALGVNVQRRFFLLNWQSLDLHACSECPEGKVVKKVCKTTHDTVCEKGEPIPPGHIRTSAGTFPVQQQQDANGNVWIKALQWKDKYTPNTASFGPIEEEGVTENAKLSDEQINSLSTSGFRTYKFSSPSAPHNLFFRTNRPHNDMQPSFGIIDGSTDQQAKLGDDDMALSELAGGSLASSGHPQHFDLVDRGGGQGCDRWLMGYGGFDCYSSQGSRCMQGGTACGGGSRHAEVSVWILHDF